MIPLSFAALLDAKTLAAPPPAEGALLAQGLGADDAMVLTVVGLGLAAVFLILWRGRRRARPPGVARPTILVDGSNVVHWRDNTASLAPLALVVQRLEALGYAPGVVFDANAGWKLYGRYVGEAEFGTLLGLPRDQIFVVPKGTQADLYLLEAARDHQARIVTNDRYRDWAESYPEVAEPGRLVGGAWEAGKVSLRGLQAAGREA